MPVMVPLLCSLYFLACAMISRFPSAKSSINSNDAQWKQWTVAQAIQELDAAIQRLNETGACCSQCQCASHQLTAQNKDVRRLCNTIHRIMQKG